jgi:hypothetical protein
MPGLAFYRGNAAIAVEGEQNAVTGSLRQRRQFFAVKSNFYTIHRALLL